jgi:ribonuclease HI
MRVWLPCHIHLEWDGPSWVEHGITFGRSGVPLNLMVGGQLSSMKNKGKQMDTWTTTDRFRNGIRTTRCFSLRRVMYRWGRIVWRCITVHGWGFLQLPLTPSHLRVQKTEQSHKVGREEEGLSSNRPELVTLWECLETHQDHENLLYLTDSEITLQVINKGIGRGTKRYRHQNRDGTDERGARKDLEWVNIYSIWNDLTKVT